MRHRLLATIAATLTLALHPLAARAANVQLELWDGQRAMSDIADLLRFTPRAIDTPGHDEAIDYIKAAMARSNADVVTTQRWTFTDSSGRPHAMTNIIARFEPANPHRIIVATHYDSIVRAYRDAKNPEGLMPGANNSASGVAVLLETARVLTLLPKPAIGIDMIFFDGEEGPKALGAGDPDWMAIGSPYFVAHLHDFYPAQKPEKAVVFDMVCDKDLHLQPEPSSLADALGEVKKFWTAGMAIAPKAFSTKSTSYPISDDHTALNGAGIPSFLVIDFEYEPYFNTTQDTIDKCSADSLQAVGRTLLQYLYLR